MRTWAPIGCTPVLRYSVNWQQWTVIAALNARRFYFRLVHGPVSTVDIVGFLKTLQATIRHKLLLIRDGLPQHRSKAVAHYLESTHRGILVERLSAYAPELNPSEYNLGVSEAA
jgi:transposase